MKKLFFILHLLFAFSAIIYSQDYTTNFRAKNKADSLLYIENDTLSYIKKLKSIPSSIRFFSDELELMKKSLALRDTTSALLFAQLAFSKGAFTNILDYGFNKHHKKYLQKKFKENNIVYISNENISIKFICSIYEILGSDQLVRFQNMDSIVTNNHMFDVDTSNLSKLVKLIDEHGFPMQKDYGSQFHIFYILMIHLPYLDKSVYQKFLNFYLDNLKNGAITPDLLAYFIDRHDFNFNGGQTYGSIADPYFGVAKIKDEKNINIRRKEIYLPNMKIWLAKRGIKSIEY